MKMRLNQVRPHLKFSPKQILTPHFLKLFLGTSILLRKAWETVTCCLNHFVSYSNLRSYFLVKTYQFMKDLSKGLIVFYQTSLLRLILSAYTFYDTVNMQGAYIHVPCYLRFQIKYEVETQTSETPQQGLVTNDVPNVASQDFFSKYG